MGQSAGTRRDAASGPEDAFVDLFAQVFGLEKAQLLVHEYPFRDIYDNGRAGMAAVIRASGSSTGGARSEGFPSRSPTCG